MENQILGRKVFDEDRTLQYEKEDEEFPKLQAKPAASKTRQTQLSRGFPANELLMADFTMKSNSNERRQPIHSYYPAAVVSAGYHSGYPTDPEPPLKGTPWEDAVLSRESVRKRKRSRQRGVEEQQGIKFLELFG